MPFVETVLKMLDDYESQSSFGKISIVVQIRSMFATATLEEGFDLINALNKEYQMRVLLGVGMRGAFYYKLSKRHAEILGL
jgi:exosome complex RNA-binding protein Rrp4